MVKVIKILSILAGFCVMIIVGAITMKDLSHTKETKQVSGQLKEEHNEGPVMPDTLSATADPVMTGVSMDGEKSGEESPAIEKGASKKANANPITGKKPTEKGIVDYPPAEEDAQAPALEKKKEGLKKQEIRIVRKNPSRLPTEDHVDAQGDADGSLRSLDATHGFLMDTGKLLNNN